MGILGLLEVILLLKLPNSEARDAYVVQRGSEPQEIPASISAKYSPQLSSQVILDIKCPEVGGTMLMNSRNLLGPSWTFCIFVKVWIRTEEVYFSCTFLDDAHTFYFELSALILTLHEFEKFDAKLNIPQLIEHHQFFLPDCSTKRAGENEYEQIFNGQCNKSKPK